MLTQQAWFLLMITRCREFHDHYGEPRQPAIFNGVSPHRRSSLRVGRDFGGTVNRGYFVMEI